MLFIIVSNFSTLPDLLIPTLDSYPSVFQGDFFFKLLDF